MHDDRWIACNKDSRIPISAFKLAMRHQGIDVDDDEVECLVAGMIWKASRVVRQSRKTLQTSTDPCPQPHLCRDT